MLECARQLSVDLVCICDGTDNCERCKVQVIAGKVSRPTMEEEAELSASELEQGYRSACQTYPKSDLKLRVPSESLSAPQRTQIDGLPGGQRGWNGGRLALISKAERQKAVQIAQNVG